jgi:hypothetical protein
MARGNEELARIRAELDQLVSVRFATGLTPQQLQRYEWLADREAELLAVGRSNVSATSS